MQKSMGKLPKTVWLFWIPLRDGSAAPVGGKKGQTRLAALWPCISASENKLFGTFLWVFGTYGIFCTSGQLVGGRGDTWHAEAR